MATIVLPEEGDYPWNLNPAIEAINADLESTKAVLTTGRLSENGVNYSVNSGIAEALVLSKKNGMVPDGVTDCSAAFQTLIDSAAASMRPVEITPGTYYMGVANIGLPAGSRIRGLSSGLNRFGANGVVLKWSSATAGACLTVNGDNTWVENIDIDANGAVATGISVLSGFESRFDTVRVIRSAARGMWIRAISNSSYQNVYVDNCGSSTLAAVEISSVSKSLNTLDMIGFHIERQPGVALQIGPTGLTGTSDIVPEFLRIINLHIEAVTDNGGVPNTQPLVLITLSRGVSLIAPYLFGGPGPLLKHAALTSHTANPVLGGLRIIAGDFLGNDSPNLPTNFIQLTAGNEFVVSATRFDNCSGAAIDVASGYGDKVFIAPETIFTSRVGGGGRSDARTVFDAASITRNPMRVQGHLSLNATAKTAPSVSTALAGSTGAPTLVSGSSDMAGAVKFGTGTSTTAGQILFHINFGTAWSTAPSVVVTANDNDTRLLGLYVARTTTGFDVYAGGTIVASRAPTYHELNYVVIGLGS